MVAQGTSTTPVHYYLYEFGTEDGDTGACIIEIRSDSVEAPPGPEFQKLTLDQLHQKGYQSPSEQLAQTPPEYIDTKPYSTGRIAKSWINIYWQGSKIKCYSGSQTWTQFKEYIKVYAERKKYDKLTGQLKSTLHDVDYDMNGTEVHVSWDLGHNPYITDPPTWYRYNQHGWHYWIDHNTPQKETDIWREEP